MTTGPMDMDERVSLHGPDPEDVLRTALRVRLDDPPVTDEGYEEEAPHSEG